MILTMSVWWVVWIEKGQLFIAYYYDLMHPMILFLNDSSSTSKHISPHIYCHLIEYRIIMCNHFMCFFVCSVKDDLKFFCQFGHDLPFIEGKYGEGDSYEGFILQGNFCEGFKK